jgi:hypothetical protein
VLAEPVVTGLVDLEFDTRDGLSRLPLERCAAFPFELECSPVRGFPSFRGQRNFPGLWWFATTGTRRRIVVFTWDQTMFRQFWLLSEYLPEAAAISDTQAVPIDQLVELLGGADVQTVRVPHDCTDGFGAAYWRRPEAYLDPIVRAGISILAHAGDVGLADGLARLTADLRSGHWLRRHSELLEQADLDVGYRLLIGNLDDC